MASFLSPQRRGRRPSDRRRTAVRPELQPLESRSLLSGYEQLNLVGYQPGMVARTDPNLNGWGMAHAPDGPFCVANNGTGTATFYTRRRQSAAAGDHDPHMRTASRSARSARLPASYTTRPRTS